MSCDNIPSLSCIFEFSGLDASSYQAQTPSNSESDDSLLCRVCGEYFGRGLDIKRHIKSKHLPDHICCPHPACKWRGSRKKALDKHMKDNNCGPKPTWIEEYIIYDTDLILSWLLIDLLPFEIVETFVLCFIEEKAIELGKVDAWGPITEWRKHVPPVLVVELEKR